MNEIDFENHNILIHEGKKQHYCGKCSATFEKLVDFENHIASVHEGIKTHTAMKLRL